MDIEFYNLHTAVCAYKKSINKNLEKIDNILTESVGNYATNNTCTKSSNLKKFKLSNEMITILQKYVKILCTVETLAHDLTTKLSDLESDSQPDRDLPNPFVWLELPDSKEWSITSFFSNLKNELTECESVCLPSDIGSISSDGETLIEEPVRVKKTSFNPFDNHEELGPEAEPVQDVNEAVVNTENIEPDETEPAVRTQNIESDETEAAVRTQNIEPDVKTENIEPDVTEFDVKTENIESDEAESAEKTENLQLPETDKSAEDLTETELNETKNEPDCATNDTKDIKVEISADNHISKTGAKKKKTVRIKEEPTELGSVQSVSQNENIKGSALMKLLTMSVHDRRKEAEKKFEKNFVKPEFQWKTIIPKSTQSERKTKEKYAIFDVEDDVLRTGDKCVFSHVVSLDEFYLHRNEELFEVLQNGLNEDMNMQYQWVINKYRTKEEVWAHMGYFCIAFLPDKRKWFRVEVIDWIKEDPENIQIELIDFGEKRFCKFEVLQPMTNLYADIPKMAIKCHLYGMLPPDNRGRWPQASIDEFEKISEMKSRTPFVTIYVNKEKDSYGIDLTHYDDRYEGKTISEILIDRGYAVGEEKFSGELDELELEVQEEFENINEAITGYDARDEARLCPFTNSTGKCFKGPSCKLEHGFLSEDGTTTDKILTVHQAYNKVPLPEKGGNIRILVTGYKNTCHFYAQIITKPTKYSKFNSDYQKLKENMNSNNIVQTYESFKIYPGIGEIMLVKDESEWFRGRCVEIIGNDMIEAFFVDFGYSKVKKMKDLRCIPDDFLHVPFQAVECLLANCQEKKDASKKTSEEIFNSCMFLNAFTARVVESEEPLRLVMWDMTNLCMDQVLFRIGLVQKREEVFPAKDCYLSCN